MRVLLTGSAGFIGTAIAAQLSDEGHEVVGVDALMGQSVVRWSKSLQTAARDFGEQGAFAPVGRGPAEFENLSGELSRTSRKLNESLRRERNLESSRRELVAWVSHDLRTPLAGLRAMAEALEDGVAVDPARYHMQISAEVDRMTGLVDDLFELSRIHAGALKLSIEEVSVARGIMSRCPAGLFRGII